MPMLRNPGPWSFAIFACACLLVGFLFWRGAPDAVKLAGSLVSVLVAAFGARSALGTKPSPDDEDTKPDVTKPARKPMGTWPEFPPSDKGGDA